MTGLDKKKVFTRKGLAYSTMSSMMKTSVEGCSSLYASDLTLQVGKDLLEDCAISDGGLYDTVYTCHGKNSCDYLGEDLIPLLLNETLGVWSKHYIFKSELLEQGASAPLAVLDPISNLPGARCPSGSDQDSSGLFPIQAGSAGLIENILIVCD